MIKKDNPKHSQKPLYQGFHCKCGSTKAWIKQDNVVCTKCGHIHMKHSELIDKILPTMTGKEIKDLQGNTITRSEYENVMGN